MSSCRSSSRAPISIELEPIEDERGFFARTWCREEFAAHGLDSELAQCSISRNTRAGTLRGMHFQRAAARRGEARSLHARCDLRRDRRPPARLGHLPGAGSRPSSTRSGATRSTSRGLRPRLPDPDRRRRCPLSDLSAVRPRVGVRGSLGRSGIRRSIGPRPPRERSVSATATGRTSVETR